jgi:hypothetical protein
MCTHTHTHIHTHKHTHTHTQTVKIVGLERLSGWKGCVWGRFGVDRPN